MARHFQRGRLFVRRPVVLVAMLAVIGLAAAVVVARLQADGAVLIRQPNASVRHDMPAGHARMVGRVETTVQERRAAFAARDDRDPAEIVAILIKDGEIISRMAQAFVRMISYALQHGVTLHKLADEYVFGWVSPPPPARPCSRCRAAVGCA
jgi:hypothetical protein